MTISLSSYRGSMILYGPEDTQPKVIARLGVVSRTLYGRLPSTGFIQIILLS